MTKLTIYPRRLRRIARVYLSEHNDGLRSLQPIGELYLYVFYDPITKIFFVGSQTNVYPYYYTNSYDMALAYLQNEWRKLFILRDEVEAAFGAKTDLVLSEPMTADQMAEVAGKTRQEIIDMFVSKVSPAQLTITYKKEDKSERKRKCYRLRPFYLQLSMVNPN